MQIDSLITFVHKKGINYSSIKAVILFLLFKFQFAGLLVQKIFIEPLLCAWHIMGVGCYQRKTNGNESQNQDQMVIRSLRQCKQ